MAEDQRNARIFGVLLIITFITSIAALALFQPVLDDPAAYIAGVGTDTRIYLGAFLELLLIIANVGWELFLGIYAAVWGFRKDAPILFGRRALTLPVLAGTGSPSAAGEPERAQGQSARRGVSSRRR